MAAFAGGPFSGGSTMARFLGTRPNRGDAFHARSERAREKGHAKGLAEGKAFLLAMGKKNFQPQEVHSWLSNVIVRGRAELEAQHALDHEIEAWDMACRVMFLLTAWRDWTRD
jgi:hypothetical protein